MTRQLFLFAALAASAVAEDVVSVFLPGFDPQPLVGSQIGGDDKAKTYILACASGTPDDVCGIEAAHQPTVVAGSATNEVHYVGGTLTIEASCAIDADIATCTETIIHDGNTVSDVGTITGVGAQMIAVTVTATGDAPAPTSSGGGETVSSSMTTNAPAATRKPAQGTDGDGEDETKDGGDNDGDKADDDKAGEDKKDDENGARAGNGQGNALFAAAAVVMGVMLML